MKLINPHWLKSLAIHAATMMIATFIGLFAIILVVLSGCKNLAIPDGVYVADVGGSKITVAGDHADLDLSLDPEKNKRYVAPAMIDNDYRECPDGISVSGKSIYFIVTSTRFLPFEIYEVRWFYDGQNILAVYPDKKIVTFTLNQAVEPGTTTERSTP